MPCERCWKQNHSDVHTCTASREYMLDIIQKEISDKTLSFGCRIVYEQEKRIVMYESWWYWYHLCQLWEDTIKTNIMLDNSGCNGDLVKFNIIWHPVMIWDVLDKIQKREKCWCLNNIIVCWDKKYKVTYCKDCDINNIVNIIYKLRQFKRKPLDDQSDDCIRYIYSLLPSEVRK